MASPLLEADGVPQTLLRKGFHQNESDLSWGDEGRGWFNRNRTALFVYLKIIFVIIIIFHLFHVFI